MPSSCGGMTAWSPGHGNDCFKRGVDVVEVDNAVGRNAVGFRREIQFRDDVGDPRRSGVGLVSLRHRVTHYQALGFAERFIGEHGFVELLDISQSGESEPVGQKADVTHVGATRRRHLHGQEMTV